MMQKKLISYNKMLPQFKQGAAIVITGNLPGHFKAARRLVYRFLQQAGQKLRRWYMAMTAGILTADEFIRLFSAIRNAFCLKDLGSRGVTPEKAAEVKDMIVKLFRAMMICLSGAATAPANQKNVHFKF